MKDLESMSLAELRQTQDAVAELIQARQEQEKAAVLEELKDVAARAGFSLDQIIGVPLPRSTPMKTKTTDKRGVVAAKYRDPTTGTTWTGRGRKPKWVEAALAAGKTLADLAI